MMRTTALAHAVRSLAATVSEAGGARERPTLIEIPTSLTVRELAERIAASPIDVIKQLMANGVMANINSRSTTTPPPS
jgi:hypothetical protein